MIAPASPREIVAAIEAIRSPQRMKLLDAADMLMERLIFAKPNRRIGHYDPRHFVDLWTFDRIDIGYFVESHERPLFLLDSGTNEDEISFDPTVIWPFRIQTVYPSIHPDWPPDTLQLSEVRTCSLKRARELGSIRFARYMVETRTAVLTPTGIDSAFAVFGYLSNGWRYVRGRGRVQTGDVVEDHNRIAMSQSIALTQRYEWAVRLGFDTGPKLRFATDPTGLRAMFRDRDKPADRDRRLPLRHWVREHWRPKRKESPEDMSYVIAHLRGHERFHWWGYDCMIEPSQFDLDRLKFQWKPVND